MQTIVNMIKPGTITDAKKQIKIFTIKYGESNTEEQNLSLRFPNSPNTLKELTHTVYFTAFGSIELF